jgi:hypothetical protein
MFSYIPYSDSHQSAYSYGPRGYAPAAYPYARARALAEDRAARQTAARRVAAEQETRSRFVGYPDDEDEDEYGPYGYTPRQRAYLEAQRKQQAAERERARLISEERNRREAENRMRREQAARESMEQFYRNLGLRTPNVKPESAETVSAPRMLDHDSELRLDTQKQNVSERMSRTPSPARSKEHTASPSPNPSTTLHHTEASTMETGSQATSPLSQTQEQTNAAAKIQSFYRSRKALSTISQLETKFEALKHSFTLPEAIDYLSADGEVITLKADTVNLSARPETASESTSSARLAFTHTNVPIRAYDEDLNRILGKLDAVESWGERKVRERRRDVVRKVELEAARVESIWVEIWKKFVEEAEKAEEEKVSAVLVDKPEVLSSPINGESSAEMTVGTYSTPSSVEHLSSSAVEPVTSMSSGGSAEDTFPSISCSSSSPPEEIATVAFLSESAPAPIEEAISALLPSASDTTEVRSESGVTQPSSVELDMESSDSDSDYESVGSIGVSSEQEDEEDNSDNGLGHDEEADFVML